MNCSRTNCTNEATKTPVISFRPKGMNNGPRAQAQLDLPVCDEHAQPDKSLFISDAGWKMIVDGCKRMGFVEPDPDTVEISFNKLTPSNPFEILR